MFTNPRHRPPNDFLTSEDREIIDRAFSIEEPTQLHGLVERPPQTDQIPTIEYAYSVRPPGGRKMGHAPSMKCVFSHSPLHWKGFVIRWKNGDRALLGSTCGSIHFGFSYTEIKKTFDDSRSRQADLIRLVAVRSLLPEVLTELRASLVGNEVRSYDTHRSDFMSAFPELHQALGEFARLGGRLETSLLAHFIRRSLAWASKGGDEAVGWA